MATNRSHRFRAWLFTLNNYTYDEVIYLRQIIDGPRHVDGSATAEVGQTETDIANESRVRFVVFQPEQGESGTQHLQGYLVLRNPSSLLGVKRLLAPSGPGRAHLEPARGSLDDNVRYCSKDDTRSVWCPPGHSYLADGRGPFGADWEPTYMGGDRSEVVGTGRGSGSRSDLARVAEDLLSGTTTGEVARAHPKAFIQYSRGICALAAACSKRRDPSEAPTIYWVHGPTGCGKSRWCYDQSPGAYWKATDHFWWDGYDGVSDVIIDDYRADFCKFHVLLNLLDRYPYQVQVKGGTLQFNARVVYITCPSHPTVMWASRTAEDLNQLLRRITHIKYMGDEPEAMVPGFVPAQFLIFSFLFIT